MRTLQLFDLIQEVGKAQVLTWTLTHKKTTVCLWPGGGSWLFHQPAVSQQSAAEKRKHQTGSWALRGQVHFYPNGASGFDVMRTRNGLIQNCQLSLNFISPVSPLAASFLFSHSSSLVFFNFELGRIFRDLKCQILIREPHRDVPSE